MKYIYVGFNKNEAHKKNKRNRTECLTQETINDVKFWEYEYR